MEVLKLVMNSISVDSLAVEYTFRQRSGPLGLFTKRSQHQALEGVSFNIPQGEVVGLVGRNGAGKSTLLKAIAGFLRPSEGHVRTKGRTILLAGTDPGFIPSMSGRANVRSLARSYGITGPKVDDFVLDVEAFAGIGNAFDRRLDTYSAGMKGKVGFGFITGLDAEIFLIDETLGVGDIEFREKAKFRLLEMIDRAGTVVMSSHSLGLVSEICDRGLLMDQGGLSFDGPIEEAILEYRRSVA